MTGRMKRGLKEIWPETNALLKKAKPIYKDLLKKVEGVSDKNPMSSNITMSFVIISIWLASERKITPEQMSQAVWQHDEKGCNVGKTASRGLEYLGFSF